MLFKTYPNMNPLPLLNFVQMLFEEDYNRNHVRFIRRNLRDQMNPFELPNKRFKQMFRLDKNSVQEIIENIQEYKRNSRIPFHLKVLATLNFCSSGSYQSSVGNNAWVSLSQPAMSRIIHEICGLVTIHLLPRWIKFPTTNVEKNNVKLGFYEKWNGRGVLGAIDGTHVDILAPPIADNLHPPFAYINRKGKHSINVMLISDSNAYIIGCCARFPGSVHDAAVWQITTIKNYLRNEYDNGDRVSHLIGDSGYPLEPWLFTPITNALPDTPEARFNNQLNSMRNVIERTNGILKGRFRCLSKQRMLMYHPTRAANIIYSCCVFHNMALKANLYLDEEEIEYRVEDAPAIYDNVANNDLYQEGRMLRNEYIRLNIN